MTPLCCCFTTAPKKEPTASFSIKPFKECTLEDPFTSIQFCKSTIWLKPKIREKWLRESTWEGTSGILFKRGASGREINFTKLEEFLGGRPDSSMVSFESKCGRSSDLRTPRGFGLN